MSVQSPAEVSSMKVLEDNSYLFSGNFAYLEELYESYLQDPQSVSDEWRTCFDQWTKGSLSNSDVSHAALRDEFFQLGTRPALGMNAAAVGDGVSAEQARLQGEVLKLINAYRSHGHRQAQLDPLGTERPPVPDLTLEYYGLKSINPDTVFSTNSFEAVGKPQASFRDIVTALQKTYCSTLGIEYMHIADTDQTRWLEQRIESPDWRARIAPAQKRKILKDLTAAEGLERYLGKKYVGQKRFSVEGGESFIPLLKDVIARAAENKVEEIVIGMAHRGRLNVLVNVLGKAPRDLFQEFEGKFLDEDRRTGDVKYHMGFSSDVKVDNNTIHLTLGFNPSHLEIIAPVIEGSVRARQERRNDTQHARVVPVIVHGDAAFAGQGVVMETFSFSQARGYKTGGTVHIVINNQIGFTTSNPVDMRSSLYCTDIAKMVQAPVLHVNADDPEAVVFATQVAFDFRMRFQKDVVIDLVCYRRQGHNESDEPSITQPLMYENIRKHPTTLTLYAEALIAQGVLTQADVDAMVAGYRDEMDAGHAVVALVQGSREFAVDWSPYVGQLWTAPAVTGVKRDKLIELAERLATLPANFTLQHQVAREMEYRRKMTAGELPLNWGYTETMAYATLLDEGYPVRFSGEDCGRGTFSHRHAVLHDSQTGESYIPLTAVSKNQAKFSIFDSILSEEAVLGFEYGYASAEPRSLVIWEAQYGDFFNGAQMVIDQFISSAEQKWGRLCGLVLFLPHGYEGAGPEHSSARPERFLQMCAQNNMQVCVPTTPAQYFHMLRRQLIRPFRKPLIVMSPKSLLRNKFAVSTLEDLEKSEFQVILPEVDNLQPKQVKRVIFCSGKVYYELLEARRAASRDDVAIIRIEQLYPFPEEIFSKTIEIYSNAKEVVWCQEEPKNQGAWGMVAELLRAGLLKNQSLTYAGREPLAAPVEGFQSLYAKQQPALVHAALGF